MPDMNENAETQQEYFGVRTDNKETLCNALRRIEELEMTVGTLRTFSNEQATCIERLEAQIENIRYYLDNEIPHDLINEATTKIWRMLKAETKIKE